MTTLSPLNKEELLALMPHRTPMRFMSEIEEVDDDHIIGNYTWKDEDCSGHFPGFPVVPGVKLIEFAAQIGCGLWGLYLSSREVPREVMAEFIGFFTDVEVARFKKMVRPGDRTRVVAQFGDNGYFRHNKLRAEVEITFAGGSQDGEVIFVGELAVVWMPRSEAGNL